MQKSSFNCPCGYEEELQTHLVEISEHMSECHQFQQLSPLNRILTKYQMEILSYDQLLLLQADICSQISRISLYANAKYPSSEQEVSLSEYGRFTSGDPMGDRLRKQVKQNGGGLLKIQELVQENSSEDDVIDQCNINCSLCNQDFNSM